MLATHVLASESTPRIGHPVVAFQVGREPYSMKVSCQKITTVDVVECSIVEDNLYRIIDAHGNRYLCEVIWHKDYLSKSNS